MNAFVVSVPPHMINVINLIQQNGLCNNDLYVVPTMKNSAQLARALKETGLFHDVVLLPDISITYPVTVKKAMTIANSRFRVFRALRGKVYDKVYYCMDGWYANSIIYHGLKKLCKNAEHSLIENGINAYFRPYQDKPWYLRAFVNALGMTCMDGRFVDKLYVYEPDMMCVEQPGTIEVLPKLEVGNPKLVTVLNRVFGYCDSNNEIKNKKYVIMEQGPFAVDFDPQPIWEKVIGMLDPAETIVKAHPRQRNSRLANLGVAECRDFTIPWEVYLANMDVSDKVIFSIFSTACIAPKLILGLEPRVVMLYKLLPVDYHFLGKGVVEFVEKVGGAYKDKSKFFVPESFEELENYLKNEGLANGEGQ